MKHMPAGVFVSLDNDRALTPEATFQSAHASGPGQPRQS
jgi:hypothetical protein